jgi:hypothetical protein
MDNTRREFGLLGTAAVAAAMSGPAGASSSRPKAWYERVRRWGQINITEDNAADFDIGFWRDYWRRTQVQGVILNAGGAVAYYPTKIPFQPRAAFLGDRDLFGELAQACRDDSLALIARLAYRASDELLAAHPDWSTVDAKGSRQNVGCMNGGFTYEYCAGVVTEIARRYRPAGFSVSGWGSNYSLCYCDVCKTGFRKKTGHELPAAKNWDDPIYRAWVAWNSDRVVAHWDFQNKAAQAAGGPDCLWMGQLLGALTLRDMSRIVQRSRMVMMDHQGRADETGFQENPDTAKIVHELLGWDKNVAECGAIYSPRLISKPAPEAQLWMYEGMAGGVSPWWHTISAYSEDKRRYPTPIPVFEWHKANEPYLYDRTPIATVGLVWSDTNSVFYGRDSLRDRVLSPWRGMTNALIRARIPYVPVHADHIDRYSGRLYTLVLPNVAAMSDEQAASIRRFVAAGGGLVATGESSLYDQFGDKRPDFALADLLAAHWAPSRPAAAAEPAAHAHYSGRVSPDMMGVEVDTPAMMAFASKQTYLRLAPELRGRNGGPHIPSEPAVAADATRHPALQGFDETDIVFYGGTLNPLSIDPGAQVLMTYIPPVPNYPAENTWMRVAKTDIAGLVVCTRPEGGRVAFMPADLDRQYAKTNFPDSANLLANVVRWTAKDSVPLSVEGTGFLDCNLYQQPGRMILHVGNLSGATWRAPLEEFLPVGPTKVRVKLNADVRGGAARLLVADQNVPTSIRGGWVEFTIPSIAAHEVVVIS